MFLDKAGTLNGAMQSRLLHVLQDGGFARLGGCADVHVDARLLAANTVRQAMLEADYRGIRW
jgi:two-component system, NtrC family, response regulator AtoC